MFEEIENIAVGVNDEDVEGIGAKGKMCAGGDVSLVKIWEDKERATFCFVD